MNDKLFLGIVVLLLLMIYVDKSAKTKKSHKKSRHIMIPINKINKDDKGSLNDISNLEQHRKYRGINDDVNSIQSKWNSDIELTSSMYNSNVERENTQMPITIRKNNEIIRNEGGWMSLDEQHEKTGKVFSEGYDEYLLRM
jgi:hypothetical protein